MLGRFRRRFMNLAARHVAVQLVLLALALLVNSAALAQDEASSPEQSEASPPATDAPPSSMRFALFQPAVLDPALAPLGADLDTVILAELTALPGVEVAAQPSLDLPAMQLAIDCVGEVVECMRAVTERAEVEALVAPILQTSGPEMVLTLLYYDVHEDVIRGVTRRHEGPDAGQATLDVVPEMLRELFRVPLAPEAEVGLSPVVEPAEVSAPVDGDERERHLGRGQIVALSLASAGLAVLAAGVGLAVASQRDEDAYASARPTTRAEVDSANDDYDGARKKALFANVGFAVGGAALVAGVTWWAIERLRKHEQPSSLTLVPSVGPGACSVTATTRFFGR